jgi:cytochrome b561
MTIWILLRAAGIGAYVALFLSVAWGLVATTGVVTRRVSKPASNQFHAFVSTVGLCLLAVHLVLLIVDTFMQFGVLDALVPMRSSYRPVSITFGVVAMYGMVLVMCTSWTRKKMPTRLWRAIHLSAVPAFAMALMHGVFAGTDSGRPWMFGLYAVTGVAVLFMVLVRGLSAGYRPPRPAPPERVTGSGTAREPASAA